MSQPEKQDALSYEQLQALAKLSPSGLAYVTNLRPSLQDGTPQGSRWTHAKHVDYLDRHLVALATGELRKMGYVGLIIEEPPRHGKSELASHYFPAWYLGHWPDNRVLLTSYEATFAAEWGGKVRDTLTEFGREIFGVQPSPRSRARDRWDIDQHRGGMRTAGVGGPLTGRGGNLNIIDDPIKNEEEASSETIRHKHKNWYSTTFRTRWEPDAIGLMIATRWHEDDLLGYVLDMMENDPLADKWLRIRLPMLAEPNDPLGREVGEALWPERYGVEYADRMRALNASHFEAMYQQNPIPPEGGLFKRAWFSIVQPSDLPKLKLTVRRWDLAATEEKEARDPDYTAGIKIAKGVDGDFYVLDVKRGQWGPGAVERVVRATAIEDSARTRIRMAQDPGQAGKAQVRHYASKVIPPGYAFRGRRETGSKNRRAEIAAGYCERHQVKLLRGPWNEQFLTELTSFPFARHDDVVDAFSGGMDDLTRGSGLTSW
jgi:predicted phage terminase large subunit-like protein